VDPGFDVNGVYAVRPGRLPADYLSDDRLTTWERGVLERLRALPGVERAAALSSFPLERGLNFPIAVEGRPDTEEGAIELRGVTSGYFETLGVPLLRGRAFTVQDGPGAARVALINQAYAERHFPDTDPIGQRIELGKWRGRWIAPGLAGPVEIVGVVADMREIRVGVPARRTVYVPRSQPGGAFSSPQFIVRTRPGMDVRNALAGALRSDDPRLAEPTIQTMASIMAASLATPRFQTLLLGLFAGSALLLTLIGIYGVVSYTVRLQSREIGIRMALGARAVQVVPAIVRRGLGLVAAGAALGTAAALALTRLLSGMLFGVTPTDARTFMLVLTSFAVSALFASWLPAHRATRIAPTASLRAE
jgi:putative ABC transport system permease protein